jgi:hypothetical protein
MRTYYEAVAADENMLAVEDIDWPSNGLVIVQSSGVTGGGNFLRSSLQVPGKR